MSSNVRNAKTAEELRQGAREFLAKRAALGAVHDAPRDMQVYNFSGMVAMAVALGIIEDEEVPELLTEFTLARHRDLA